MPERIESDFKDAVAAIAPYILDDYVANSDTICGLMCAFAENRLALRYFLFRAGVDERFRRLTSAQSFYVFGCNEFHFRMNAWYPASSLADSTRARLLDEYFSIDSCHNHSVDFFTVGLLGPGYTTEFRESLEDLSNHGIGDKVTFSRSWNDRLTEGKALFVRKSSIFHTQYKPESYSVSLNLVVREPVRCKQFSLEDDKETIRDVYDLRDEPALQEEVQWL